MALLHGPYLVKKKLERSLGNCALPSPTLIETSLEYPKWKVGGNEVLASRLPFHLARTP